jgi:tight adherence protein B
MDYSYYFVAVSIFFAIVLFLEGIYNFWNAYHGAEVKRVSRRLQTLSSSTPNVNINLMKHRVLASSASVERLLLRVPHIHLLDRFIYQSGLNLTVSDFLGATLIAAIGGMIFFLTIGLTSILVIFFGVSVGFLPYMYINHARHRRMKIFDEKLPDALDLMARAMKAGHAFPGALQMVGSEMTGPISSEFKVVFDEINFGLSVQDALANLIARLPSTDLSYFVIAVVIQNETGGNLAELLGQISALIRARLKLFGTIRVLSAEGRLSAWILTLLPFVLALLLSFLNPKFFNILFTDPQGIKIITIAFVLMLLGVFWMSKVVKIRV